MVFNFLSLVLFYRDIDYWGLTVGGGALWTAPSLPCLIISIIYALRARGFFFFLTVDANGCLSVFVVSKPTHALMLKYFRFLPKAEILESRTVVHGGGEGVGQMNIIAFITSLWMTPCSFASLMLESSRCWNWIPYTQGWLYKGIQQDGYCTITDVMKPTQRVATVQTKVTVNIWWSPTVQYRSLPAVEANSVFSSQAKQSWRTQEDYCVYSSLPPALFFLFFFSWSSSWFCSFWKWRKVNFQRNQCRPLFPFCVDPVGTSMLVLSLFTQVESLHGFSREIVWPHGH